MSGAADDSSIRENRSASTNRAARPAQDPYYRLVIARQWMCHTFPMTRLNLHDLFPARAVLKRKMWHRRLIRIPLILTLLFTWPVKAQERPPLPYYDWGACPFECCTYREWETVRPIVFYKSRSKKSPEAFRVGKSTKVKALTGVVITKKYGVTKVLKPMTVTESENKNSGIVPIKPGDIFYTLHYLGEDYDLFWFHGKVYGAQISSPNDSILIESRPDVDWWAKIANPKGQTGWTNELGAFDHVDACE
jgi:hypothetical protein